MFFEDEEKEQSKNMDDYDLDFEEGESVSWDKLLDEAEAEQLPKRPSEDDLLLEDEESFDNMLQTQELNIEEDEAYEEELVEEDSRGYFEDEVNIIEESPEIEEEEEIGFEPQALEPEPEIEYQDEDDEDSIGNMLEDLSDVDEEDEEENESYEEEEEEEAAYSEPPQPAPQMPPPPPPSFEPVQEEPVMQQEQTREKTPIKASNQKDSAALWGVIAAVALIVVVGLGAWFFLQNNQPASEVATGDFNELMENNENQQGDFGQDEFGDAGGDSAGGGSDTPPGNTASDDDAPPSGAGVSKQVTGAADTTKNTTDKGKVTAPTDKKDNKDDKDKKDTDGKKVTVKIMNSGRPNPFVPTTSINLNKFGFMTAPRIDILEPPTKLGNLSGDLDRLVKITVSGILYDAVKPSAIINVDNVDYFVQKNDRVDDFTVAAISKDMVVIRKGNNMYRATIGQNFSSGHISGQITRTPQRQYVSVGDIGVSSQQTIRVPQ